MAVPTVVVEVEFTAGVWTAVTADVDWGAGYTITVGRTSPQQQPQPSSVSLTLRNSTGKYTPGVQVLSTGVAAPYWPNVTRRKRIRVTAASSLRFLGYIKAWAPVLVNGVDGMCQVTATDRMDQLGRIIMPPGFQGAVLQDAPKAYWPLTEPVGSTSAADASGVNQTPLTITASGAVVVFGQPGPGVYQGTGVKFAAGQYLIDTGLNVSLTGFTIEAWINYGSGTIPTEGVVEFTDTAGVTRSIGSNSGTQMVYNYGASYITAAPALNNGLWHHIVVTQTAASGTLSIYIDNVLDSASVASALSLTPRWVRANVGAGAPGLSTATVGHVALYDHVLTAARVGVHYNAAQQSMETTAVKVARFLGYANLTSADWLLDTSTVTTGTYSQDGKDVATACQDMAVTEGGGSVFYVSNGVVRFTNRLFRKPAAPVLTLDAELDLDRSVYQPSMDDLSLVNQVSVSRQTESGAQSTQLVTNAASVTAEGLTSTSVSTYTSSDADALRLAQQIVAEGSNPGFRLGRVAVDLANTANGVTAAAFNVVIGSRIRITNLPAGQAPSKQLDILVEGWSESGNIAGYQLVFDTSPADTPARGVWGDIRTNLVLNPSIETNTTDWAPGTGTTLTRDAGTSSYGSASLKVVVASGTAANVAGPFLTNMPVTPGVAYSLVAQVRVASGLSVAYTPVVSWLTSGSVFISSAAGAPTFQGVTGFTNVGFAAGTAPGNAAYAQLSFRNTLLTTAIDTFWVDAVLFEARSTPGTYFDGTPQGDPAWVNAWTGTVNNSTSTSTAVSGRWAAAADCALNAAILATDTTVVVKTPTSPPFTTVAARYPMKISVGAERIQLNSAPGATSPQTFTGVTRGVDGTTAAAQLINATVQLTPAMTWTL